MLDQNADEPLVAAEDRAVEHDGRVLLAVLAHECGVEQAGHHAVGLDGPDLPGPSDRVGEVPFELRSIEGALARQLLPAILLRRETRSDHRVAQLLLGAVPLLVSARTLFRPERELDRVIVEAEIAIDAVR